MFHILKFSAGENPFFTVRRIGKFNKIKKLNLTGIISFKVMPGKYCIGNMIKGTHRYCFQKIEKGYQCNSCFKYNPFNFCAFCSGTKCYLKKKICGEHFVYLAAFANKIKVGVTSIKRFPKRVIEQGADFATKIAHTKDGLEARRIESEIRKEFNISDKMYSKQKIKLLHKKKARKIGREKIEAAYEDLIKTIPSKNQIEKNIVDLSQNYVELENQPEVIEIKDNLSVCGKIIGSKGNFIVLKISNNIIAFNGYDLVGRTIKID